MEKMEASLEVMNEILGYLGTRPYQEVFGLIEKLQAEFRVAQAAQNQPPKLDAEPV